MVAFSVSPSVKVTETDLSGVVPAIATSIAAVVGRAKKGPAFKRVLNVNDNRLVENFGAPDDNNFKEFYSGVGYLTQGSNLFYTRVAGDGSKASTVHLDIASTTTHVSGIAGDGETILIPGSGSPGYDPDDVDTITNASDMDVVALGPGTFYDDFYIAIVDKDDYATLNNPVSGRALFALPVSSGGFEGHEYLIDLEVGPLTDDEFGLFVLSNAKENDSDADLFVVEEKYLVSVTPTKKDGDGRNMYVQERVNRNSSLVRTRLDTSITTAPKTLLATQMAGGSEVTPTDSDRTFAWELYRNPELVDVNILVDADSSTTIKQLLVTICEDRRDAMALLDVPLAQYSDTSKTKTVDNIVDYADNTLGIDSSYAALYANHFTIFDKFGDRDRVVPASGFVAGVLALTDFTTDAWIPPAGLNRGVINGIKKLKLETELADRDMLYTHRINPIVNFRGGGAAVVWGQKTLLNKSSSFNRVNVRRLFIVLEKTIATLAEQIIFEINDTFTRNIFKGMIEPFLVEVTNKRGIFDFKVVIDETNNTSEVIDANGFVADIFIKPTRSAEFINLNFFSTRTGQSFEELIAV